MNTKSIDTGLKSFTEAQKRKAAGGRMALVSCIALTALAAAVLLPSFLTGLFPSTGIVFPQEIYQTKEIYVDGVVEEQEKKDITVQMPIVPEQVMAAVGDFVKMNEIIATVDTGATEAAILSLVEAANAIPKEYLETFSGIADAAGISNAALDGGFIENNLPTEIRSPIEGVVTSISLVKGAVTTPRSTVCTVSKLETPRLHMNIGEAEAAMVKAGDTVIFKATATGEEKYTGTVTKIFPSASKVLSGTTQKTVVGMYVQPDNGGIGLKPGYTVAGAVMEGDKKRMLTVPYDVILQDDDNIEYVYCYENGKAVRTDLQTGEELTDRVEIISGLTPQSAVIKNGRDIKENNQAVRLEE